MIVPADINRMNFTTTRLKEGYDQNEVDDFLDRLEVDYAKVMAERDRLAKEVELLRRQLERNSEAPTQALPLSPVGSAEKILVAAQKTADAVEADANAEAGKIRAAARAEADNLKSTARSEADELRTKARIESDSLRTAAEAERQRILNQLEGERSDLEEKIEILKSKRSGYKSWLRNSLARIEEEEANGA